MESFGLANFLQSLLRLSVQTPTDAPAQTPTEESPTAGETPMQAPPPPDDAPTHTASTDAILQYMQAHDERARRIKR